MSQCQDIVAFVDTNFDLDMVGMMPSKYLLDIMRGEFRQFQFAKRSSWMLFDSKPGDGVCYEDPWATDRSSLHST